MQNTCLYSSSFWVNALNFAWGICCTCNGVGGGWREYLSPLNVFSLSKGVFQNSLLVKHIFAICKKEKCKYKQELLSSPGESQFGCGDCHKIVIWKAVVLKWGWQNLFIYTTSKRCRLKFSKCSLDNLRHWIVLFFPEWIDWSYFLARISRRSPKFDKQLPNFIFPFHCWIFIMNHFMKLTYLKPLTAFSE